MCCDRNPLALRGQATLTGVMVLLILTALLILIVARFTVSAVKTTEADYRVREAQNVAEAGVAYGIAYLHANRARVNSTDAGGWMLAGSVRWSPCSGSDTAIPCGNGVAPLYSTETLKYANVANIVQPANGAGYTLHYLTTAVGGGVAVSPGITVIAEGQSADGTARALVRQGVRAYGLFRRVPPAPIVSQGNVNLSGNLNIWANPDGRGAGLPLSIWASGTAALDGATKTCSGAYSVCPPILSSKTNTDADVLASDPAFPADLFDYFFDITAVGIDQFRNSVTSLGNCSTIAAQSSGVYWIAGDCDLSSVGTDIGTEANPLVLIVDGDFRFGGNVTLTGVVYIRGTGNIQLTGSPVLRGALVGEQGINVGAGTVDIVYSRLVLDNANKLGGGYVRQPAAWSDAP